MSGSGADSVRFGRAEPSDAPAIVDVMRAGFDAAVLPLTIYGALRVERWVSRNLEAPSFAAERLYVGAWDDEDLVGCIDLARTASGLFLNYVSVAPTHRRRGVATGMLRRALSEATSVKESMLSLDVFEGNEPARRWYGALGCRRTAEVYWFDASFALVEAEVEARVIGLSLAEVGHAAYGFSEVRVETAAGSHRVGRLGEGWWRLGLEPDLPSSAGDHRDLLAVLAKLDPPRRLLVVSGTPWDGAAVLVHSLRLQAAVGDVRRRLAR